MKKYTILLILVGLFSGCSEFLEVTPKGKFIPQTIKDYEELSSNPSYSSNSNALLERLSDNIYFSDARIKTSLTSSYTKAYMWAPELFINTETDGGWDPMYNNIYNANIIIEDVRKLTDGTEKQRKEVLGDAFFNRAYAYWCLVNTYAKNYDATTAETDLGVPLITIPDLEAKAVRATVAEVFGQILEDLNLAKDQLPKQAQNVYRNTKGAAFALLARVYLSMGDYSQAKEYANLALKENSQLFDFNSLIFKDPAKPYSGTNLPIPYQNPEMLSYKETAFSSILTNLSISPDFLELIGKKDLRYLFNWTELELNGSVTAEPYPLYLRVALSYNIAVPEMMLIVAESEAREGHINEALDLLNTLREKRFSPADYLDLVASTPDEALRLVIDERRIELFGKGLRWFDMKRLDNESQFRRTYTRANTGSTYTLEAGSKNFVLQIPSKVMLLNSNIVPNPR